MKHLVPILLLLIALAGCQEATPSAEPAGAADDLATQADVLPSADAPTEVVFMCQYGKAKSLVASLYFERMAEARGLPVHVLSRGVTPSDGVPEPLAAALRDDGFEVSAFRPASLSPDELEAADYMVSFGTEVPESPAVSTQDWSDVSALSENYPQARDEIVAHVTSLLDQIERQRD